MGFDDLAEFIRPGFDLPVLGHTYYVPPPPARDGVWLQAVVDAGESLVVSGAVTAANKTVLTDDQERTAFQMALGSAYDEMVAAGVPWPILKHAGMTALVFWTRGRELAESYWAGYGQGKDAAPGKAAKGSRTRKGSSRTARSTPTPA